MGFMRHAATASVASAMIVATSFAATPAQAASYTKCYRDAPVTTCITTSKGRSVGFKRLGSYLLQKSKVDTTNVCTVSQTETTKYSISVAISAEASAWVFAKVSATVSGGLEKSTSIQAGVSRSFKQKKGEVYRCEWGYSRYKSTVTVRTTVAGKSHVKKGTFTGPQEMELRVVKL